MKSIQSWNQTEAGKACKTSITIGAAEGAAFETRRKAEIGPKLHQNAKVDSHLRLLKSQGRGMNTYG